MKEAIALILAILKTNAIIGLIKKKKKHIIGGDHECLRCLKAVLLVYLYIAFNLISSISFLAAYAWPIFCRLPSSKQEGDLYA